MANLKFSQFTEQADPANVQFLVGYNGSDNVRIAPSNVADLSAYLPLTGGTLTGNLGINVASPSRELDIDGNIQLSDPSSAAIRGLYGLNGPMITFNGLTFDTEIASGAIRYNPVVAQMNFKVDGSNDFLSHDGGTGETVFSYSGSEKMRIEGSGNVGIGTTSPTEKLEVNGNVRASKFYLASTTQLIMPAFGTIYIVSNNGSRFADTSGTLKPVTASAFNTSSDYRLKSNIVPLEGAISRLNQLEVHRFNWNNRLDEPKVDGFIAHEVAPIIPEAVLGEKDGTHPDGTPDYQGIDQSKIVPLLTAALQEAITKIENLENRIQILENK